MVAVARLGNFILACRGFSRDWKSDGLDHGTTRSAVYHMLFKHSAAEKLGPFSFGGRRYVRDGLLGSGEGNNDGARDKNNFQDAWKSGTR